MKHLMKRVLLLFTALSMVYIANAQTVENITVTPEDDKIIINFRIGGSTDAQFYNIILTCSMDGKSRFEPKTVIGDVGDNIRGGRPYYTIEWDVFRDLDEVGAAEFFVKVDMVRDLAPIVTQPQNRPQNQPQFQPEQEKVKDSELSGPDFDSRKSGKETFERKAILSYNGSLNSPYGLMIGTAKNFGFYGCFRFGGYVDELDSDIWYTITAGLTKYVLTRGKYRLHAFAGGGVTRETFTYQDYTYDYSWSLNYLTLELGIINVIGRININLGLEYINYFGAYPELGLGFVF